jgi:hypothetical protein
MISGLIPFVNAADKLTGLIKFYLMAVNQVLANGNAGLLLNVQYLLIFTLTPVIIVFAESKFFYKTTYS